MQNLTFKFLVIGNSGVGKTSLVHRLCLNEFSEEIETTIGLEYMVYKLSISDTKVQLQIWDTAGQEQYRSLGRSYYRDAVGVLIVFAYNDHKSLDSLDQWISDARTYCHPNMRVLLVGNKIDLEEDRAISKSEIEQYAKKRKLDFIETSAKTNANVHEAFQRAARSVYQAVITNEIRIGPTPEIRPVHTSNDKGCCN